jgi:adenylate cyclase
MEKHPIALRFLAATLAMMGRVEEARAVADELLRRSPSARVSQTRRIIHKNPAKRELLIEGLLKAGVPE